MGKRLMADVFDDGNVGLIHKYITRPGFFFNVDRVLSLMAEQQIVSTAYSNEVHDMLTKPLSVTA